MPRGQRAALQNFFRGPLDNRKKFGICNILVIHRRTTRQKWGRTQSVLQGFSTANKRNSRSKPTRFQ